SAPKILTTYGTLVNGRGPQRARKRDREPTGQVLEVARLTMWYRAKTARVSWPVTFVTTRSGTPTLTMLRTALPPARSQGAVGDSGPAGECRRGRAVGVRRQYLALHPPAERIDDPRCNLEVGRRSRRGSGRTPTGEHEGWFGDPQCLGHHDATVAAKN